MFALDCFVISGGAMAAKEGSKTRRRKPEVVPRKGGDYIAGARFKNNQTQIFLVKNAYDMDDARRMVMDEIGRENVCCLLVSESRCAC
ncbi:MAG: hypothetical protein ACK5JI_00935 [Azonexus sp.]